MYPWKFISNEQKTQKTDVFLRYVARQVHLLGRFDTFSVQESPIFLQNFKPIASFYRYCGDGQVDKWAGGHTDIQNSNLVKSIHALWGLCGLLVGIARVLTKRIHFLPSVRDIKVRREKYILCTYIPSYFLLFLVITSVVDMLYALQMLNFVISISNTSVFKSKEMQHFNTSGCYLILMPIMAIVQANRNRILMNIQFGIFSIDLQREKFSKKDVSKVYSHLRKSFEEKTCKKI